MGWYVYAVSVFSEGRVYTMGERNQRMARYVFGRDRARDTDSARDTEPRQHKWHGSRRWRPEVCVSERSKLAAQETPSRASTTLDRLAARVAEITSWQLSVQD